MSVVVAVCDGVRSHVACDGRMTSNDEIISENVCKFVKPNAGVCIGVVGSYRALELVERAVDVLSHGNNSGRPMIEAARLIAERVRALLSADGWLDEAKDGKPRWFDVDLLIAFPSAIFFVNGIGSVIDGGGYYSIGSGANYALGALDILRREENTEPGVSARMAVDVAIRRSSGCGGNIYSTTVTEECP